MPNRIASIPLTRIALALLLLATGLGIHSPLAQQARSPSAAQPASGADSTGWAVFQAPSSIEVSESVRKVPAGWTAGIEAGSHVFCAVTFFDGPPADMASLVYDSEVKKGQRLVLTWTFDPQAPKGICLRCRYSGTALVLDRELPKGTTQARVVLDTTEHIDGYDRIVSIELR